MSDLRNNLEHAKQAYKRLRYDGDLAGDVFARLDADEGRAGDEHAASMRIDRPATRAFNWRPFLALAAAVAVVATTVLTLTHTGRDQANVDVAIDVLPTPIDPRPSPTPATPTKVDDAAAVAQAEPATDFTVVPSYQSFAISVPVSLSLASVDEYDRQAQEQSRQTAGDATGASVQ